MTAVDRDLVADPASTPGVREPGTITLPSRVAGSAPVTRSGSAGGPDRRWLVAIAMLAAALPLATDPGGWFVFVAARWAVLLAGSAVLLVGLAFAGHLRSLPATRWWAGLVGVAVLSALGSGATRVALLGTDDRRSGAAMWLVHAVMFVIGGSVVRRRGDLRLLVRGVSVGALAVTVLVAAQRLGWSFPAGVGSRARPGGPLGNADFLGAYSGLALLAAIGAAVDRAEADLWRLAHLVAAMGAAFCLILSGTRAAWLGIVAGLVAFAVLAARGSGVSLRSAWAGVALVAVGLVGLGMWAGMGDRLDTVTSGTAAGRLATWERTASVIGDRPVLGWGPEGMAEGFGRRVDDSWEREYGRRLVPDRAHNGLLDVGASLGLVGLAVYLGTIAATGRAVRRSMRAAGSPAVAGVVAALVAYLVQQQFLFQLFDVDALAWLLAGAVVGLGTTAIATATKRVSGSPPRSVVVGVTVGALVLAAGLAVRGVQADRAARRAADGEGTAAAAVANASRAVQLDPQTMHALLLADAALADGDEATLAAARDRLGEVQRATFDDGRLTLARARLARAIGLITVVEESRSELLALLRVDPSRSDGWAELGETDLRLGDPVAAQRSLERAVGLRPDRAAWWVRLAVVADQAGDAPTALDAIRRVDPSRLDADGLLLRRRLLLGSSGASSDQ